jgi:hypothetical protein
MAPRRYGKGEVFAKEQPFLVVQTIESKHSALCCSCCFSYLGDWRAQVRMPSLTLVNVKLTPPSVLYRRTSSWQLLYQRQRLGASVRGASSR